MVENLGTTDRPETTQAGQVVSPSGENTISNNNDSLLSTTMASEKSSQTAPEIIQKTVENAIQDPEEPSQKRIKLEETAKDENSGPIIPNPLIDTTANRVASETNSGLAENATEAGDSLNSGPENAANSQSTPQTVYAAKTEHNGETLIPPLAPSLVLGLHHQENSQETGGDYREGQPSANSQDASIPNAISDLPLDNPIKNEPSSNMFSLDDLAASDALTNSLTAIQQFNEGTPPFEGPSVSKASTAIDLTVPETPAPKSSIPTGIPPAPVPYMKRNRLVIIYDKPRFSYMKVQLDDYKASKHDTPTIVELSSIDTIIHDQEISEKSFFYLNFSIEYNDEFQPNLRKMSDFIEANPKVFQSVAEIGYHFMFDSNKKWADYSMEEKDEYKHFLAVLNGAAGEKVVQCSLINKYEINTVYLTEKDDLAKLGQEIQDDIQHWKNLRVFDYGENCIRFLPGVRFPDTLETINIGGGYSLETLTGFKMPTKLKVLIASSGSISSLDNINFPYTLERLNLLGNKIYFLNYVEFPPRLINLDLSQNRIDNLRGVNFPRSLKSLSLSYNPIECIKGAKFHEGMEYLDLSCIPNESMTGVKFPDLLVSLNLQQSMTNTRGLKLPAYLKKVNLGFNGVNSINPLKLPNTLESLYLANNNIKTLNKVQFPTALKELYLGNNMITTLKNVQFPIGLEVLDFEMDPDLDETEKHITTLKDVTFPPNLKVLKLGYHSIKAIESMEFPASLISLSLMYNDLKVLRNIRFGTNLKILDLSGNQELTNIDYLLIPESVVDLRIPTQLVDNLPAYIVERANRRQMVITRLAAFAT